MVAVEAEAVAVTAAEACCICCSLDSLSDTRRLTSLKVTARGERGGISDPRRGAEVDDDDDVIGIAAALGLISANFRFAALANSADK